MALIDCNECGSQISDKAVACPKCGNPMDTGRSKEVKAKTDIGYNIILVGGIIVIALTFFIVAGFVGYVGESREHLERRKQECGQAMLSNFGHSTSGYADKLAYEKEVAAKCEGLSMYGKSLSK